MSRVIKNPLGWKAIIKYDRSYRLLNREFSDEEIRKEYTRLRDIARKRIKTLQASEFSNNVVVRENVDKEGNFIFPKLRDIQSNEELAFYLHKLARLTFSKLSTVSGLREMTKNVLQELHSRGFEEINKFNLSKFGHFMDYIKTNHLDSTYDSERVSEMTEFTEQHKIPESMVKNNFDYFYNYYDVLAVSISEKQKEAKLKKEKFSAHDYIISKVPKRVFKYKIKK